MDSARSKFADFLNQIKELARNRRLNVDESRKFLLLIHDLFATVRTLLDNRHNADLDSRRGDLNVTSNSDSWRATISSTDRLEIRRQLFAAFQVLLDNNHMTRIDGYGDLVIGDGRWSVVLGREVPDYLADFHEDLLRQQPDNSSRHKPWCPNILMASFNRDNKLVLDRATCQTTRPAIYGLRCRLCPDRRSGDRNITYVGQTKRSVHERVCNERKGETKRMLEGLGQSRPFIQHVCKHYDGEGAGELFAKAIDAVLLPIGNVAGDGQLGSWEFFWQWILQARLLKGGHSQR